MPNALVVRPYQQDDLAPVLTVWEAASRRAHHFLAEQFFQQEREDIAQIYLPNSETWVAEIDKTIVGFVSLLDNEVGGLFVALERQGQGVGRTLLDKACALKGSLVLKVFAQNHSARAFYARYGFVCIDAQVDRQTAQQILNLKLQRPEQPLASGAC